MDPQPRFHLWYFAFAALAILLFQDWWQERYGMAVIPYSEFEQRLDHGGIAEIDIAQDAIYGTFVQPVNGKSTFMTVRVDPVLADKLQGHNVRFAGVRESTFLRDVLSWVIPALVFFALWSFLLRRMGEKGGLGGLTTIGKSRAKVYVETDTKVTFRDVAGVDEAEAELQEIVEFLKAPQIYGRLGARIPKGVLLVGPPGTGKTLLARAVAGEAGVPFYSINGSEFVEMFVGVGAARVRDLFEQAREHAPAIIFIDELDALGRARGAFPGIGGHDEREQTLNQLLSELDGFDTRAGLVLLAATNRPEILDPALLRAGRFDRQILVDRPDRKGRVDILRVDLTKIHVATDVDIEQVAALTTGFTGADLANLVNEAATVATRRKGEQVTLADFTVAIERITAGLEKKNRLLNPHERKVVAYHEMGHALVALSLPGADVAVHKVSIIPRGIGALGYTIQRPTEDRYLMSREELEDKIAVLLGGRAAEVLVFGALSTGAADDLAKATDIARAMVMRYGMDEGMGCVIHDKERGSFLGQEEFFPTARPYSEATAQAIDAAVRGIMQKVFDRTVALLRERRSVLEAGAGRLLEIETLDEAALQDLMKGMAPAP
ncbi:MAG TPA: ATP-dependent zinc metalloprotease FtsH [Moraxellaceae bacterium]|nr:ATP-dependent zinc metalloprotease FtsH [Moraxellaceae bacterium]